MNWTGYITNAGLSLIANWGERSAINFTSAVGGTGITEDESVLKEQTQVANFKQNISIVAYKKDGAKYSVKLQAFAAEEEYVLNQIGLYASLDGNDPVLFAIFQNSKGENILSAESSPLFLFSFYATVSFSNKGELSIVPDESAFITLGTLKEYLSNIVQHKEINDYQLNYKLASNIIYHVKQVNDFYAPFSEAIVIGTCQSEDYSIDEYGDFPQFAFATDGKIYTRIHSLYEWMGVEESYTEWSIMGTGDNISKEEINNLIATHTHSDVSYSEVVDVDLTKYAVLTSTTEHTTLTEKELQSDGAIAEVNISGYVEIEATSDYTSEIEILKRGETEYSRSLLTSADSTPFSFSGYIDAMRISTTFGKLSFSKFTVSETENKSGFATPEMLKRLITLEENVEAVGDAFEEIHAYAQALIGGDEE